MSDEWTVLREWVDKLAHNVPSSMSADLAQMKAEIRVLDASRETAATLRAGLIVAGVSPIILDHVWNEHTVSMQGRWHDLFSKAGDIQSDLDFSRQRTPRPGVDLERDLKAAFRAAHLRLDDPKGKRRWRPAILKAATELGMDNGGAWNEEEMDTVYRRIKKVAKNPRNRVWTVEAEDQARRIKGR